eukprot:366184-Chlamydomonas_euryale.AAC.2
MVNDEAARPAGRGGGGARTRPADARPADAGDSSGRGALTATLRAQRAPKSAKAKRCPAWSDREKETLLKLRVKAQAGKHGFSGTCAMWAWISEQLNRKLKGSSGHTPRDRASCHAKYTRMQTRANRHRSVSAVHVWAAKRAVGIQACACNVTVQRQSVKTPMLIACAGNVKRRAKV